jgi:hypothetical protein
MRLTLFSVKTDFFSFLQMNNHAKFIIEVRDSAGRLDFANEKIKRKEHPFLFSKREFTMDELCYYAAFGQGRNRRIGPMNLGEFMKEIGVSYRQKTW